MCGLTGFWNLHRQDITKVTRIAEAMAGQLAHRGPDGHGVWVAEGLALAHRRLAILDLSEAANQPMTDPRTGNVMVLNGEIYNFKQLRGELEQRDRRAAKDAAAPRRRSKQGGRRR